MRSGSGIVLHPEPPPCQSLLLLPLDFGGGALGLCLQLTVDKHCSRKRRASGKFKTRLELGKLDFILC